MSKSRGFLFNLNVDSYMFCWNSRGPAEHPAFVYMSIPSPQKNYIEWMHTIP